MLLVIIPIVIILIVTGLSNILVRWRDNKKITEEYFRQAMSQMISVVLSSIIGFGSAFALWKYQEDYKGNSIKTEALEKIFNEISANRLMLELESHRQKSMLRTFLKTDEWNNEKHYLLLKTPNLRAGLTILYYEIEDYNNIVSLLKYKVMEYNLTEEQLPTKAWESIEKSDQDYIGKLKSFEILVARELVLQNVKPKREYEERFGKWQNDVEVPYYSKRIVENKNP